jgi:myo-inositol 2-dehydrogenase/D-chiro-inositol 1-dehydrogenase
VIGGLSGVEEVAKRTGAIPLSSRHELDADHVDAAIVSLPPALHPRFCSDLLRAGIPVLCEKPIAPDHESTAPLVSTLQEVPLTYMIGFHNRFSPVFQRISSMIGAGLLGEVFSVKVYSRYQGPGEGNWRYGPSGGVLQNNGIHYLDLVPWLLRCPPVRVDATKAAALYVDSEQSDTVTTWITLEGGITFFLECTWWPFEFDVRMEILGSLGKAEVIGWDANEIQWSSAGEARTISLPTYDRQDVLQAEILHFVSCVKTGSDPSVGLAEGLHATILADAVLAAAKSGKPIPLQRNLPGR